MIKNVVVGISGGVDSAVTAFLLKNKGKNKKFYNFILVYTLNIKKIYLLKDLMSLEYL